LRVPVELKTSEKTERDQTTRGRGTREGVGEELLCGRRGGGKGNAPKVKKRKPMTIATPSGAKIFVNAAKGKLRTSIHNGKKLEKDQRLGAKVNGAKKKRVVGQ